MPLRPRFLLLLSLCLLACTATRRLAAPADFAAVSPARVGMSPDSLARIDGLLQLAVDSQWVSGAVALVARQGQIVYERSFGMRDIASADRMAPDALFRIASMTKPITSLAILQLYEQGKLDFQDPVSQYIPAFAGVQVLDSLDPATGTWQGHPAQTPITLHHLLTHTSGISYGFADPLMQQLYGPAGILDLTTSDTVYLAENIDRLARLPLKHEPGARWTYGLSIDVLGRVVEVASGQPFDQYLRTHIFAPLGMDDTGFYFGEEMAPRLTTLYSNHPEYRLVPYPEPAGGGLSPRYPIAGARTYFSGGGGLTSTARDYLRFCQAILNGGELFGQRIIRPETLAHMRENKIGDLRVGRSHFSYGFSITPDEADLPLGQLPGRLGWGGAFQTHFWIDPAREVVAILLTQVIPSRHQQPLYEGFEQAVNAAMQGTHNEPRKR